MNKLLKRVDSVIKAISWLTIFLLCLSAVLLNGFGLLWGQVFFASWLGPVATAAAVGYLTNYLAIWLLFKPYQPHWGIQGVIPREKEKLAIALGEQIPRHLLKPDQLAEELGTIVKGYLQNQEQLEKTRTWMNHFLSKYSASIADFLLPYLEQALQQIVQENLNAENLSRLYQQLAADWLNNAENTDRLAAAISLELQKRAPEFREQLRESSVQMAQNYIQQEHPRLTSWLNADKLPEYLIKNLDWDFIEAQIVGKLKAAETRVAVSRELSKMTLRLQEYLQSAQADEDVKIFLAEKQQQIEALCRQFLADNIPRLVDQWLRKGEFWQMIEKQLLPFLQELILSWLEQEKMSIVEKFKLSEKIQHSVQELETAKLHDIINDVSGRHLVAIQLLGYVLGAIAGGLLIFIRIHPAG